MKKVQKELKHLYYMSGSSVKNIKPPYLTTTGLNAFMTLFTAHCFRFISFYKLLRSVGHVASLIVLAAGRAGGVGTPFKKLQSTPDFAPAAGNRPRPYELWLMT